MIFKTDWIVACHRVVLDAESGNLNLMTCYETIAALQFPAIHHGFALAAVLTKVDGEIADDEAYDFRFVRVAEDGTEQQVLVISGEMTPGTKRVRVFNNFPMLRLFRPETVGFRIDWRRQDQEWEIGGTVPLEIKQMQMDPQQELALREGVARLEDQLRQARDAQEP